MMTRLGRIKVFAITMVLAAAVVSLLGAATPTVACGSCSNGCYYSGNCYDTGYQLCVEGSTLECTNHSFQFLHNGCP
jgi:hypothetical protein